MVADPSPVNSDPAPNAVAFSFQALRTSIVGMSSSSAELGGDAPTLSPPDSRSDWPGRRLVSSSNIVASVAAPPTGTVAIVS